MQAGILPGVTWLVASVLILGLGPALYRLARQRPAWLSALDGFLLVAICGLVLLDVLPETLEQSGWLAILFVLAGFLGPSLVEHWFHRLAGPAHRVAILLALLSLVLHALVDGAALVASSGEPAHGLRSLPLAVVLHRIPVGLAIWWLLRPREGTRAALAVLGLIALSTAAGFFFVDTVLAGTSGSALGLFQALVAGSLMHVVVHRTDLRGPAPADRRLQNRLGAFGALAGGLLLVWVLPEAGTGSDGGTARVAANFWRLTAESAPPLLLAYLMAGLISTFLPQASVRWMSRGDAVSQSLKGMAVGLPLPVCSCGVVPLFRSLSRRGAPAAAAVAFLISTPELSLDAVLLSFPLLGTEIAVARLLAAAAVAMLVGLAVGILARRTAKSEPAPELPLHEPSNESTGQRVRRGLKLGLEETVDHTAPWILAGLLIAALAEPLLSPQWLARLPGVLEVPLFAAMGIPMYVCASGATPLVAVLLLKGLSPGAAIAFLLTGPATNVSTFGVVSETLGRRTALVFGVCTAALAVGLGYLVNALSLEAVPLALGAEAAAGAGPVQLVSAVLLGVLFGLSFWRRGPRDFLTELGLPDAGTHQHA